MRVRVDCVFPHVRQCAQAHQAKCCSARTTGEDLRSPPSQPRSRDANEQPPRPTRPPASPRLSLWPALRYTCSEAPRFELGSQIAGKFQCAIPGSARDRGIVSGEPPKPPSRHRVLGTRRAKGRPTSCSGRPPSMLRKAPEHAPEGPRACSCFTRHACRVRPNQSATKSSRCVHTYFWLVSATQKERAER